MKINEICCVTGIACFNGEKGGTLNTINFAKKNNKELFIINPNNF